MQKPTHPEAPNGETRVDISFRAKDDISGVHRVSMYLRDPHGVKLPFLGTPVIQVFIFKGIQLSIKSMRKQSFCRLAASPVHGGLAEIHVQDKAKNKLRADFTEIVRFEVSDVPLYAESDVNQDGTVNIQDLVLVANAIGHPGAAADGELKHRHQCRWCCQHFGFSASRQ